jgi:hypothetical protein
MANVVKEISKEDRKALIRDVMIRYPDYKRFGYNRKIIALIKAETSKDGGKAVVLEDYEVSRFIKEIEKEWQKDDEIKFSKKRIIDMQVGLFESKDAKVKDKRMILQDIAKITGNMGPDININNFGVPPEKEDKLKEIFGERTKEKPKKKKEKK